MQSLILSSIVKSYRLRSTYAPLSPSSVDDVNLSESAFCFLFIDNNPVPIIESYLRWINAHTSSPKYMIHNFLTKVCNSLAYIGNYEVVNLIRKEYNKAPSGGWHSVPIGYTKDHMCAACRAGNLDLIIELTKSGLTPFNYSLYDVPTNNLTEKISYLYSNYDVHPDSGMPEPAKVICEIARYKHWELDDLKATLNYLAKMELISLNFDDYMAYILY